MELWLENFARANFRRSADTAHDLKTPLNVAVLNLELLRMRLRKLSEDEDTRAKGYMGAIELELRRMGRIFDAFFLMSTPPEEEPVLVDLSSLVMSQASPEGDLVSGPPAMVLAHESRIRDAVRLFFEGANRLFGGTPVAAGVARSDGRYSVTLTGVPAGADFEATRIFKFYYTDAEGSPDLSLAVARLIAETYGGEVSAVEDRDKVSIRLSLPLGAE